MYFKRRRFRVRALGQERETEAQIQDLLNQGRRLARLMVEPFRTDGDYVAAGQRFLAAAPARRDEIIAIAHATARAAGWDLAAAEALLEGALQLIGAGAPLEPPSPSGG